MIRNPLRLRSKGQDPAHSEIPPIPAENFPIPPQAAGRTEQEADELHQ